MTKRSAASISDEKDVGEINRDSACPPVQQIASSNALLQHASDGPSKDAEKVDWATSMRLKFTPKDMLNADGSLNQLYFKPRHASKLKEKKWTQKERRLLMEGICRYGIGNWGPMKEELLPDWDSTELRLKTQQLMGRQSLKAYKGWKGDEDTIRVEFEKNKQIGTELGCWKGGVLVADDEGKVAARLGETISAAGDD